MNAVTGAGSAPRPAWGGAVDLLRAHPVTAAGAVLIALVAVAGLAAPVLAPYDPLRTDPGDTLRAPGGAHLMGTDDFGEDIWSRVLWGARIDLEIALVAVAVALALGCTLGALAGFSGGWVDEAVMRSMDVLQAFPSFILAMGIAAALGPSLRNLILSVALINVAVYARLMRARLLVVKQAMYAMAARGAGNPPWRLLLVHLIPNCLTPIFVQSSLQSGWAILTAAGLSFVGLGVRVPEPEWGVMVAMGVARITSGSWWVSFYPGLCIALVVMGFNLIGDGLQDLLDPQRR
ncbi:MAG TPA: ABC transporter permease [bacterium]|nr:ABC transporter permease [bacterium]